MSGQSVHICCHAIGLCDLTLNKQRNLQLVGRMIAEAGRFSVFDATANGTIARTMDKIRGLGWFETDHESSPYPWVLARLTDKGRRELGLT